MSAELSKHRAGRLIQDREHPGQFNMAADLALAKYARIHTEPVLRLYSWTQPTLSLGFHQSIADEVLERCAQVGIAVVRRPTGGRAVLHHHELTYSLSLPLENGATNLARSEILKQIGELFLQVASKLGLNAELVRAGERRNHQIGENTQRSPFCYDSLSRYEVQLGGCKWIGSAQRFFPGVMLQHGSIPLRNSPFDIRSLVLTRDSLSTQEVKQSESFPELRQIGKEALQVLIPRVFSERWGITWREEGLSSAEIAAITAFPEEYPLATQHINDEKILLDKNHPTSAIAEAI
ncbi:MAG: biotin/lipoate A/B protein ligase family protein [bacterium]